MMYNFTNYLINNLYLFQGLLIVRFLQSLPKSQKIHKQKLYWRKICLVGWLCAKLFIWGIYMEVKCESIQSIVDIENKNVVSYGLRFYESHNYNATIKIVRDMFQDKEKSDMLVNLINENELSEIQINDVIDDALLE